MITLDKLKEFEECNGGYDCFEHVKINTGTNINSDDEWFLIEILIQDIQLVNKSLASKEFSDATDVKIRENFKDEVTIKYLKLLAEKKWK